MLVKELRNLSGIGRVEKRGVYKLYVYKSNMHYIQACDYMQKINYCIQDLNEEIPNLQSFSNKNVVYIITLVTWIKEAVNALLELYQDTYLEKFVYSAEDELKKTDKYATLCMKFVEF